MNRRKFIKGMMATGMLAVAIRGQIPTPALAKTKDPNPLKRKVKPSDRKAAAANARAAGLKPGIASPNTLVPAQNGVPDYFGPFPNYANSPIPTKIINPDSTVSYTGGIRKFVDSLPGLTFAGKNNLGKYIPLAVPVADPKWPDADYYEIGLVEFTEKFHSDLNPSKVRGYVQLNDPANPATRDATGKVTGWPQPHYLGPLIMAQRDRVIRVKFSNLLPVGAGGDLFLPVDTTLMGAGMGPDGKTNYTQNRATLHLHGGNTPWISDGTAHQWTTPAGEITPWPKGVTVQNVPDMTPAGPGELTFFYTNQQSARLMFYHDHSCGITRLNVYAGEAAGYLLNDPDEQALVASGAIPADQIPLIIQDKTFIDPNFLLVDPNNPNRPAQDPTWPFPVDNTRNDLWFPHVYMPNQNPYDSSGANAMGRWDYGPWFWPPFTGITHNVQPNPYYDSNNSSSVEPPYIPGTPNTSIVPEGFMDTPVINGQAYPYLDVEPKAYRFRILNACNDRSLNLQLYKAKAQGTASWTQNADGSYTVDNVDSSEVAFVPAVPGGWPDGWPTPDGRDGGFPDPVYVGPTMIQIGTEGGLLPAPAPIKNRPIGYNYNRRDITVLNVLETALYLGPAERADVIVDFSGFDGQTIILYNDSPAPVPAFDPRNDYYTGDPDETETGGAPSTLAGFGPNTRTMMQIRVANSVTVASNYIAGQINIDLPAVFARSQDRVIVPNAVYNAVYGPTANLPKDSYGRIQDTAMNLYNPFVSAVQVTNGGSGYTTAPNVTFTGGYGSGAAAMAVLAPSFVTSLNLGSGGAGYGSTPTVTITGGSGSGATGSALISGPVSSVTITNAGRGYKSTPSVTFQGGSPTTVATGTAIISAGRVTAINITNPGVGYSSAPTVIFTGGNPTTPATATARISAVVKGLTLTFGGSGYSSPPVVTFTTSPGDAPTTPATATATLAPVGIASIIVTNGGSGYLTPPTVAITAVNGNGAGATATASIVNGGLSVDLKPKAIQELFDPEYGRMNAILGAEIPNSTMINQTTIPYYFVDPPNEILKNTDLTQPIGSAADGMQIWKITHNGVDTHAIHFHLFNVQLVNRVGWDGAVKPPDPNELGWKETVRMNPLEDIIVALRPYTQKLPNTPEWAGGLPNSIRPLDVTRPIGSALGFTNVDPTGQPATVTNQMVNFGWEYTWHCHLLGHEENDMMRPIILAVMPVAPSNLAATAQKNGIGLSWKNNARNATNFTIQRATNTNGPWSKVATVAGTVTTYTDASVGKKISYFYRVIANNVVGYTQVYAAPAAGYPNLSMDSAPSSTVQVTSL